MVGTIACVNHPPSNEETASVLLIRLAKAQDDSVVVLDNQGKEDRRSFPRSRSTSRQGRSPALPGSGRLRGSVGGPLLIGVDVRTVEVDFGFDGLLEVLQPKQFEDEHSALKRLAPHLRLNKQTIQDLLSKNLIPGQRPCLLGYARDGCWITELQRDMCHLNLRRNQLR